ncbi:MAG: hypothetical protein ABJD11_10280 [Gemmatimonadota bacterium]
MPDHSAVHAIIPLSLLEALRNLDTPVEDGLEELAGEIVAKRLGLSATVAAQITRYQETARRDGVVPREEALAVFRLAGRRPDAGLVFADAGRRAARYTARTGALPVRALVHAAPGPVSRRVGARAAVTAARRIFRADLLVRTAAAEARVPAALSTEALPDGSACPFYGAAFGELLRCLVGFEGAMLHDRCRGRGDDICHWRATASGGYE